MWARDMLERDMWNVRRNKYTWERCGSEKERKRGRGRDMRDARKRERDSRLWKRDMGVWKKYENARENKMAWNSAKEQVNKENN
jgi:hypothetical protein